MHLRENGRTHDKYARFTKNVRENRLQTSFTCILMHTFGESYRFTICPAIFPFYVLRGVKYTQIWTVVLHCTVGLKKWVWVWNYLGKPVYIPLPFLFFLYVGILICLQPLTSPKIITLQKNAYHSGKVGFCLDFGLANLPSSIGCNSVQVWRWRLRGSSLESPYKKEEIRSWLFLAHLTTCLTS